MDDDERQPGADGAPLDEDYDRDEVADELADLDEEVDGSDDVDGDGAGGAE